MKRELLHETLTIRLTLTQKRRLTQAGKQKFGFKTGLGIATMAREILLNAVDAILEEGRRKGSC